MYLHADEIKHNHRTLNEIHGTALYSLLSIKHHIIIDIQRPSICIRLYFLSTSDIEWLSIVFCSVSLLYRWYGCRVYTHTHTVLYSIHMYRIKWQLSSALSLQPYIFFFSVFFIFRAWVRYHMARAVPRPKPIYVVMQCHQCLDPSPSSPLYMYTTFERCSLYI